jgi:hypothetical protein
VPAETLLCKYLPDQEKGWAPLIYTFNLLKNFVSTSTIRRLKVKNNAFETFDILIKGLGGWEIKTERESFLVLLSFAHSTGTLTLSTLSFCTPVVRWACHFYKNNFVN